MAKVTIRDASQQPLYLDNSIREWLKKQAAKHANNNISAFVNMHFRQMMENEQ